MSRFTKSKVRRAQTSYDESDTPGIEHKQDQRAQASCTVSSPDPMASATVAPEPFPQLTCVVTHVVPNDHLMKEKEAPCWFTGRLAGYEGMFCS